MPPAAPMSARRPTGMRRLTDRFYEEAGNCRSIRALKSLLGDAARELGFDFFALLHHASLDGPARGLVRIDNYPADWVEEFLERDFASSDPVHLACRRTHGAFLWSRIDRIIGLGPKHRLILKRGRQFGIGAGMTVPINIPGEPSGSCSFAVRTGCDFPQDRLTSVQLIGSHAFEAARRICGQTRSRELPHLSRRERQCLELLAAGKTDWEIARILGISVETARQYVKRARKAYDAVNRTQLAVLALRDSIIRFEDLPLR